LRSQVETRDAAFEKPGLKRARTTNGSGSATFILTRRSKLFGVSTDGERTMTGHLSGVAARFEEVRLVLREGENIHLITRQVAKHTIVRVWVWAPPTGPGCTLKAVGRWLRARVNSSCVLAPASASTCPKSMDTFHGMTRLVALRASRSPASLLGAAKASLCATAELVTRWRQLLLLRRQRCRACRRCHRSNWHISRNSSKISKRQCPEAGLERFGKC